MESVNGPGKPWRGDKSRSDTNSAGKVVGSARDGRKRCREYGMWDQGQPREGRGRRGTEGHGTGRYINRNDA